MSVPPNLRKTTLPVRLGQHAFAYVFEGSGTFRDASKATARRRPTASRIRFSPLPPRPRRTRDNRSLVLFGSGDEVTVQAGETGIRFLLVSGKPLEEPVAWYGPIVMNTQRELEQAVRELNEGTFIKSRMIGN